MRCGVFRIVATLLLSPLSFSVMVAQQTTVTAKGSLLHWAPKVGQRQAEETSRTMRIPLGSSASTELPYTSAGLVPGWSDDGTKRVNETPTTPYAGSGAQVQADLISEDSGQGDTTVMQPYTGAMARTQHEKNSDSICVFDFMSAAQIAAVRARDTTLSVSSAIQAALDAANGRPVLFPAGSYRVGSTVSSLNTSGTTHPGVRILGEGANNTIFINKVANGPAFKFDHRVGSSTYGNQVFSIGSFLQDVSILGDGTTANSDGLYVLGLWGFRVIGCSITHHTRYGIQVDSDSTYNPDISATVRMTMSCTSVSYNKIGFYSPIPQACPTFIASSCNFDWNTNIGIIQCSNFFRVQNGSISFNGYSYTGDGSPSMAYGGMIMPDTAHGSASGCMLEAVEIDGNHPQQVWANSCVAFTVQRCQIGIRILNTPKYIYGFVYGQTTPAGTFGCNDILFGNNIISFNSGDYTGITVTVIKTKAACMMGTIGDNIYHNHATNLSDTSNLYYIVEDTRTGGYAGAGYALRMPNLIQNGYTGLRALALQFRNRAYVYMAKDTVVSMALPINVGSIVVNVGYSGASAVLGYVANPGSVWNLVSGTFVNPAKGVLTGTTGTDLRLNVSCSGGILYIENRLTGGPYNISITAQPTI